MCFDRERRAELFAKWRAKGGVFLIGYTAFRNLSLGKNVKDRHMAREICYALQDGPDILVCDEAHMIKNTRADTTQALKQVKCQRRIALTGSPLQNNLMEYYCMVDFVREGFLGSSHEFRNRFQNPIENGQHTNSTLDDVKIMNQRSHILYEQLKGFVQRMDMNVVKNDLPPKTVFVIAVKLSPLQRKLYKRFLDVHGFTKDKVSNEKIIKRSFFAGYQALAQNRYFMKSVFMGKKVGQWLMKSLEQLVVGSSPKYFYLFREGDSAYTLQRSSNSFGLFLLLTELKVGGSRRSIIIPVGRAKNGWRVFGLELRKLLKPENYVNGGNGQSIFVA
nr:protein chromatin remodeling 20 [Quercus suber]